MERIITLFDDNISDRRLNDWWVFLFYVVIIILYHVFGYIGHFGYDDIHYAELAKNLLNGQIDYGDHATYRLPVILLTALFYSLFGISDLTSSLPAMLVTCSILLILFQVLRKEGLHVLIIGLGLTILSSWFLFYSDKLMPDIHVALSVLAIIAVIDHHKYRARKKRPLLYAFLLTISALYGFMAKGTIVLILPLLLFLFLFDIITGRDKKFWIYTAITGISLLVLYFVSIWWLTGNFFGRFAAIAGDSYLNICSYSEQPIKILLIRILTGFFKLLVGDSMAIGFVLVLALFVRKLRPGYFKMEDSFSFFMVSSLILLFSANFMTISPTSYSPMCLDPRHYLYLLPVVSVPAAKILVQFAKERLFVMPVLVGLFILVLFSFEIDWHDTWTLYLPLVIFCTAFVFLSKGKAWQSLFPVIIVAILLVQPMNNIFSARKLNYKQQKKAFREVVMEQHPGCLVITNDVQKRMGNYYLGFDTTSGIELVNYDEFRYDSTDTRTKILFLNWYTRYLALMEDHELPYFARNISPANDLLYENKDFRIVIYEMHEFAIPELSGTTLIKSFNDFETAIPCWYQDPSTILKGTVRSGSRSNRVEQYSSTFACPLDSLDIRSYGTLLVHANLYARFDDITDARLVISVENPEEAYIWKALDVNRFMKAYGHWWPVSFQVDINITDLTMGSELKIYLLNGDTDPGFIDDFGVEVIGFNQ